MDVTSETATRFQFPTNRFSTSPNNCCKNCLRHFQDSGFPRGILPIAHHDPVPRTFLWKCFEFLDLQLQRLHLITRNRDETTRSRGQGTSAPLWQRLRACCPRTVFYNGPIMDGAGNSAKPTWTYLLLCLPLENSVSTPIK